jgi:hypothetical protein
MNRLACVLVLLAACSSDTTPPGNGGGDVDAGAIAPGEGDAGFPTPPDGGPVPETACQPSYDTCVGWGEVARCVENQGSIAFVTETCASGTGCSQGQCVADACSDECSLGQNDCELYDVSSDSYRSVDANKTHDRARKYEEWIRDDTESLFRNQIVSVRYNSSARNSVDSVYIGDSAMHTGIYLAGEAHRLAATGSWRARKNVRSLVDTFHVLFNISGDPGMLATSVFPAGDTKLRDWTNWSCSDFDRHCNVEYAGEHYDYVGEPSRDMYMGPLLGMVPAYDALGPYDEAYRARIREDIVAWAVELMRLRTLPVRIIVNGGELPVQNLDARFFIPESADWVDGAVEVSINLSDLSNSGTIRGGQEFMPNPSVFFRQAPSLAWLPDIPRSSSAMMVPAILRAALHVTDGVPEYATERAEIEAFYYDNADDWGNVDGWIDLASSYTVDHDCDSHYFGVHIAFIGAYMWALLEDDPTTRARLMSDVVTSKVWDAVADHKNSFFTLGYAAVDSSLSANALSDGIDQVEDFPKPARVRKNIDSRGEYGGSCSDDAVDIEDRPVVFLHWHSNPWSTYDSGDTRQTYPGHDYLVAYWMGRSSGLIDDDTPSRCLRVRP